MPTRIDADFYALGVRLKQSLLLTCSNCEIANERFVHAIVLRLEETIAKAKTASTLLPSKLQTLDRLESGCRWMLDGLSRGSSDAYLEELYDEFHRRVQLAVDALVSDETIPSHGWLNLGLEIADGSNEYREVREGDVVESFEVTDRWRFENPEAVSRLAEQLGQVLGDLMPTESACDAPWMNGVPNSWIGWARLEPGLAWLERTVGAAPPEPATPSGPPAAPGAESDGQKSPALEPMVPGGTQASPDAPATFDLKNLPTIQQKLYEVLEAAGSRLTTNEVLSAYAKKFGKVSESQVKSYLAEMRRAKIIDNRDDVKPPGYGIVLRR